MNRMTVEIEVDGVIVRMSAPGAYSPDIMHDLVARALESLEGGLAASPYYEVEDGEEEDDEDSAPDEGEEDEE